MNKYVLSTLLIVCPFGFLYSKKITDVKVIKSEDTVKKTLKNPTKIVTKKSSKERFRTMLESFANGTRSVRAHGGVTWYRLSDITLLDVGSNRDSMMNDSDKVVPFGGLQAGLQWDAPAFGDGAGLFFAGLGIQYEKRKEAITMDFYDGAETSPSFVVKQDVNDLRIVPQCEYEFFHNKQCSFGLLGGFIVSFKTLDKFKVFEKSTDAYIGQRLVPRKVNILGRIGFAITRDFKEHWALRLHYNYTRGHVKYKTPVIIETPDVNAAQQHQDALLITDVDAIVLPEKPRMKLHAHEIGWSMIYDF